MQNELNQVEVRVKNKKQNNNKKNGLRFENKLKDRLVSKGYIVVRSAASKSLIDLIALKEKHTLLIQCKSTKTDNFPQKITHRNKEFTEFSKLKVHINCEKLICFYSYKTKTFRVFQWDGFTSTWNLQRTFYNLE